MKRFASDRVAGLMERLGLDEDMAIESRIVSKTIESAQSRVEGYNFDIRKHVVEYDDVISKQRETIYEERDKVLRNEDLGDTVQSFLDREIDALVDRHAPASLGVDEWDMDGLSAALDAMGMGSEETKADALWDLPGRDAIAINLKDMAAERLEAKVKEVGEDWPLLERLVLLRTIDSIWVEHLTELDEMRQGIGLRGHAQEDPLNAFKKEAFGLFEEMSALIRHQVATTIFRVSIVRQQTPPPPVGVEGRGDDAESMDAVPAGAGTADAAGESSGGGAVGGRALPKALPAGRATGGAGGAASGSGSGGAIRPGYSPSGTRMGRNDQCWCGSGKKYKKCHGQ
jgi:preprotein translocase subunit SecA